MRAQITQQTQMEAAVEGIEHPREVAGVPAADPIELESRSRTGARVAKRAFDIVFSFLAIVVVAPFWLLIMLAIKADSPGPIFFRQRRVGWGGTQFDMLKFRTMVADADARKVDVIHLNEAADGLFKISRDPRLTRFGRFLRSTSLDELPQLLHVLTGEMSLVGPRPLVPEEDAAIHGEYRRRLEIRPGMTGPWQVAGASQVPINEMVKLDLEYVGNWSFGRDLKLLFGTVGHVFRRRGI